MVGYKFHELTALKNTIMKLNKIHLKIIQGQKNHQTAQGFLLIEVLVAIILTLVLTGISMGVVVMATAIKVRGDEISDATRWIQEDIEDIKVKANEIDAFDTTASPIEYRVLTKCTNPTISNSYGSLLMSSSRASSLNGAIITASDTYTKRSSAGSRTYDLVRTSAVKNAAPYNVLQITYTVNKSSGGEVSRSYAEIIPGASFYCK